MDFEEQLEKAEKLETPSLVGSSLRSADDSPHQNYIHPEKYKGVPKAKANKRSLLNTSIGASLDDLINEGALLGSEEDFDRFLDDSGNAKNPTKFLAQEPQPEVKSAEDAAPARVQETYVASDLVSPAASVSTTNSVEAPVNTGSIYESENYSTPNLSEYQLDHQISDHSELLDSVQSFDLNRLPSSNDRERAKSNVLYAATERAPKSVPSASPNKNSVFSVSKSPENEEAAILVQSDSIHTPYFHRDGRSQSRPRTGAREDRSRSRSRSAAKPHLARGDSYKSTHVEPPTKYELPPDMALDEEDDGDDRRTRQSKPTMGDSIAAAEAGNESFHTDSITREPSLVTTGDYTNFNADIPSRRLDERTLYSVRSESSTNYLRSISRSRLRQPNLRESLSVNEKLDSNPHELAEEGVLISDDPYGQMSDLDNMLKKVLKKPLDGTESAPQSKNLVNDVPAGKGTEIKEQLLDDKSASPTLDDQKVENKEDSVSPTEEVVDDAPEEIVKETQQEGEKEPETTGEEEEESPPVTDAAEDKVSDEPLEKSPLEDTDTEDVKLVPVSEGEKHEEETPETEDVTKEMKTESLVQEVPTEGDEEDEVEVEDEKSEQGEQEETEEEAEKEEPIDEAAIEEYNSEEQEPEKPNVDVLTEVDGESRTRETVEEPETDAAGETVDALVVEEIEPETTTTDSVSETVDAEEEDAVAEKVAALRIEPESETTSEDQAAGAVGGDGKTKYVEPGVPVPDEVEEDEKEEDFFDVSPEELRKHLESLPVYLYTSLAGGMQIIQRTNRLATILQGNGVKFEFRDLGTDETAKKLWRRYAQGKTLPGVVRGDDFIGDWKYIDEINEDYRLHEVLYETI